MVSSCLACSPSWSPDGKKIVFQTNDGRNDDICVIDPDGQNLINITNTKGIIEGSPSWSPIENKIVYRNQYSAIFICDENGNNKTAKGSNERVIWPVWSPNGRKIAYHVIMNRKISDDRPFFQRISDRKRVEFL